MGMDRMEHTSNSSLILDLLATQIVSNCVVSVNIWANYKDLSRGHLKLWFSKGIPPNFPSFRFRNYTNFPRNMYVLGCTPSQQQ